MRTRLAPWWLVVLAALCGLIFFSSAPRLWPLVPVNLEMSPKEREANARRALDTLDFPHQSRRAVSAIAINQTLLDYLDEAFGRERTAQLLHDGLPAVTYEVRFFEPGQPRVQSITLLPDGHLAGAFFPVEEDDHLPEGPLPTVEAAGSAIRDYLRIDVSGPEWKRVTLSQRELKNRIDRTVTWERTISREPELRERASVTFSGTSPTTLLRQVIIPADKRRALIERNTGAQWLELAGGVGLALSVIAAFIVFVRRLERGAARVGRASGVVAIAFVCFLIEYALQYTNLEPQKPFALSLGQSLLGAIQENVWTFALLIALVAAGDAVAREEAERHAREQAEPAGESVLPRLNVSPDPTRAESLWAFCRGRVFDPGVRAASWNGFLVGLVCGGVLAGVVWLLSVTIGVRCNWQPRDFALTIRNTSVPAIATLSYFLYIAMIEELGYRFFAGPWLQRRFGKRWLAIFLPALVYGLTHTSLGFLPPAEPFWARPLVMTLVGCVWGWAYFRFDALTVILSHLTADLFIFNWPTLANGQPLARAVALAVVTAPLLPAALGWLWRGKRLQADRLQVTRDRLQVNDDA